MLIAEHFDLREFIDPVSYSARGDKSIELIDIRIVKVANMLRILLDKPIIINNWHTGGQYKESCLRSFTTGTGAKYSQHKYGRAIDIKVPGIKSEDLRNFIRNNWDSLHAVGLTTIEKDTPTWVHCDCRYTGLEYLYEVPYK